MKTEIKDVVIRALKTFWQAALAHIFLNAGVVVNALSAFDMETLKAIAPTLTIGTIAAGLSAVYNGVIKPLIAKYLEWYNKKKDTQGLV